MAEQRLRDYTRQLQKGHEQPYSVMRLLDALCGGDKKSYERQVSDSIAKRLGPTRTDAFAYIPIEQTRDLTVASAPGGGYLVGTENAPGDFFIDALRAASVTAGMGVQTIDDLTSNVTLPKLTADATTTWLSLESTPATESTPTFGQVAGTPKTVSAYVEISRQLALQTSPAAERFLMRALGAAVGIALDAVLIAGTGTSGEPLGIIGTTGVGSESGASFNWDTATAMIFDVATANGLRIPSAAGFVGAPDVEKLLSRRQKFTGSSTPIWDGNAIGGRRAMATNSAPAATLVYGDWSSVVVLNWGGVQIAADSSTNFRYGITGLRALWSCDIAVLHGASFSKSESIT
jgi:HK97 family phage major capsid protein